MASSSSKEVFVKTESLSEKRKTEELREKLQAQKEKRRLAEKYANVKGLADESDDEDAADWYRKVKSSDSRKRTSGSDLRRDSSKRPRTDKEYSSKDIKGLAIGHKVDAFEDGRQVILTLKDKGVLDDDEDVLQNVNMVDDERVEKSNENKKKRLDYKPWDDDEFDNYDPKHNLLSKYDEEIEGSKTSVFRIGDKVNKPKTLKDIHDETINSGRVFSTLSEFKVASEYYTQEEMVKFKKTKRKGALRKKNLKNKNKDSSSAPIKLEIDNDNDEGQSRDHGTRSSRRNNHHQSDNNHSKLSSKSNDIKIDVSQIVPDDEEDEDELLGPDEDLSSVRIEEDQAEKELQLALQKARKLKLKEMTTVEENIARIAETVKNIKSEPMDSEVQADFQTSSFLDQPSSSGLVLNKTSEFCRNLGTANNNDYDEFGDDEEQIKMELDSNLSDSDEEIKPKNKRFSDDEEYDDGDGRDFKDRKLRNQPILEEEPQLTCGVAGALQLALRKGYLDREQKKQAGTSKMSGLLSADAYAIEEKFNDNDYSHRKDRYSGEVTTFKEKEGYKPDFKLDYVDDKGNQMNAKEAFRYLSHKFHGKTSGKNKTDKRLKKLEQESKLRQMALNDSVKF